RHTRFSRDWSSDVCSSDLEDGQRIVDERYPSGNRGTRFQSWSMAKSFTSAAVGIALQEGRIRSIDDAVTAYLPELKGSGYDGVRSEERRVGQGRRERSSSA